MKYFCHSQGVSRGCYDEYSLDLPCNWIDVTEVVDDNESLFRLRIVANSDRFLLESNYDNNAAVMTFKMGQVRRY